MGSSARQHRLDATGPRDRLAHVRQTEPRLRRLVREPLVHFALLGGLVFGLHRAFAEPGPVEDDGRTLVLDARFAEALRARARTARGEDVDPDAVERDWIREEALVREARRLGIDRGDTIVRRRLVQKMELWLEATVDVPEPTEAELAAALVARAESYRRPATVAFEHVFFSRSRPSPEVDARDALGRLTDGALEDPAALGDPFLLGHRVTARSLPDVAGAFGAPFVRLVDEAPNDVWSGPFESSYGVHLVRVTARTQAQMPTLPAVRERLREELVRERRERAVGDAITTLVSRYHVRRDGVVPSAP